MSIMNRVKQILAYIMYFLGDLMWQSTRFQSYLYNKFMIWSAELDVYDEIWEEPKPTDKD